MLIGRHSRIGRPGKASACAVFLWLFAFLFLLAGTVEAATYYYDNNGTNAGFGTAGGTWGTTLWSTDSTGLTAPGGATTTIGDSLNFGTGAAGLAGGTITISGTQNAGDLTFGSASGDITFSGGTLNLAAAVTFNTAQCAGTGTVLAASVTLTGAESSFAKTGAGKLRVDGGSALSGTLTFSNGMLVLAGTNTGTMGAITVQNGGNQTNGWIEIAPGAHYAAASVGFGGAANAVMHQSGALTTTGNFVVGSSTAGAGVLCYLAGPASLGVGGVLNVGVNSTGSSSFNMSGGTVTVASTMNLGNSVNGGTCYLVMSGGSITVTGQVTLWPFQDAAAQLIMGGGATFNAASASGIQLGGAGVQNRASGRMFLGAGSEVTASKIYKNSATDASQLPSTVYFNGGTLRARATNNTDFLGPAGNPSPAGSTALGGDYGAGNMVYVLSGGAIIDTAGFDVTVHPRLAVRNGGVSGQNVASVAVASAGSGYSIAPAVGFAGGGGSGATAYATLDATGGIAAVVVSEPGTGYGSAPTASLSGGQLGPGGVAGSLGAVTMREATLGGLTKVGAGTLTLASTNNTYTGPTVVSNGTLKVSGAIMGSGAVTVAGGGTLTGTGVVAGATSVQAGGTLSAGDGGRGEMTFGGNLTFEGGSTSAVDIAAVNLSDRVNVTGTLTIQPNAGVIVSDHANGTYTLFQYGTLAGSARNLKVMNMQGGKIYPFRTEGNAVILDIRWGGTVMTIR